MTSAVPTPEAATKISDCLSDFETSLIKAASDIEESQNPGAVNTRQITPAMVDDAYRQLRKYHMAPPPAKKSPWIFVLHLVSLVCSAGLGLGGNNIKEGWGQALFFGSLFVGLICFTVASIKEYYGE